MAKSRTGRRRAASGPRRLPRPTSDREPAPAPRRRGFDPAQPFQVGRRPSAPLLLAVIGLMWVAAGVVALFVLTAGWRFVPAVVFVGVGLYYVRGASATVLRRERRGQR
ncbi:MAG: hypothetical protein ACLQAN_02635 [Acidimicrobiales bacterium]